MLRVAVISVHTCPLARLGSKETGGMNVYVRELSRHLGARGAAIDVFTRRQDDGTPDVVAFGENVRVIHLRAGPSSPADKYEVIRHLPEFARGVMEFERASGGGYQLVHSHYWSSAPVAIALAHRWNVPLVTMFHTLGRMKNRVSENGQEREHTTRMEIEQAAMHASDMVVAASPTDMDQMVAHYGAIPSRIRIVPGGVDTELFRPLPRESAREALDMGPEKQLLFVGRIQQLKGLRLLIPAFARVTGVWRGSPKPRLTIVGGGRPADGSDSEVMEAERLRRLAAETGVEALVEFAGAVPHEMLPLYYSAADVVAVPSLYESFGLVALEAMACGAPVVASRVGGLQWTVRHGETGFLVPATSPEAFSSAIGLLLRDEGLRAEMSMGAVRVARGFSWDVAAERTLEMYGELVPALSDRAVSLLSP
jgi:D-inositol-3-phosphate glycosyltransferase